MTNRSWTTLFVLCLVLVALAAPELAFAADPEIDAEVRVREYVFLNNDFDSDVDDPNNHAVMRTSVGLSFDAGRYASAYVQFRDTRGLGEPATTTTSLEQVDLHQGYVHIANVYDSPLAFRIGRQEMAYGGERQIGALDWNDVGRSFDGIRMMYDIEDFGWFHAFAMKLNETGGISTIQSGAGITQSDDEAAFLGGYLHYDANEKTALEVYVLDLYRDSGDDTFGALVIEGNKSNLFTAGGRVTFSDADLGLKFYAEGAMQFGSALTIADPSDPTAELTPDHKGYAAVVGADYSLPTTANAWIGFEFNLASGDDGTDPSEIGTYQQLFPTAHGPLGYNDFVGWQNILAFRGRLGVDPNDKWKLWVDYHVFQVVEAADAWYLADGSAVLAGNADFDSALGNEVNVAADFRVDDHLSFLAKFGMWMPGDWQNQASAQAAGVADPVADPADLDSAFRIYVQTIARF
jgi:hypothetical protein